MSFSDLLELVYRTYRPALILEDVFPYEDRVRWANRLTLICAALFGVSLLVFLFSQSQFTQLSLSFASVSIFAFKIYGLFLTAFTARMVVVLLEAMHRSYYFRGLNLILHETDSDNEVPVSFEVAALCHYVDHNDITAGFLRSPYGEDILLRLGIDGDAREQFLKEVGRFKVPANSLSFDDGEDSIILPVFARTIYKYDQAFAKWLQQRAIQLSDLEGAADWIMRTNRILRNNERWYSRDVLGRVEGLGKDLVYGEHFTLDQFSHPIERDPIYKTAEYNRLDEDGDVEALEAVLARSRQANAVVVGQEGSGIRDMLSQFAHKVHEGLILPPLQHKHIVLFDVQSMISSEQDKARFEDKFSKAVMQAAQAGNIVLVIEEIVAVIYSANQIGVDVIALLAPYFDAPELQIILTTNEDQLHRNLERDGRIKENFEVVRHHSADQGALIRILEQRSLRLERKHRTIATYQGVLAVANGAHRYFPDGVMPDKALDLLEEAIIQVSTQGEVFMTDQSVASVIENKTGIPLGEVGHEESDKLLHLEEAIRKRVIGQEAAVSAIAGAMRRARAGINDPDRPIGTFLFLGPTGVGKTETAKALAEQFFGSEEAMHRLDMSEFQGNDAVAQLIGFPDGTPGRLANMLREEPYRLLLLDEFEKAARGVHDLFLQVLDEGEFTDAAGNRVNARNSIIIATSNAGADLLYEALKTGQDISAMQQTVIDTIINRGTFRPELVNRFDATILFQPLVSDEAAQIAKLSLASLKGRLQARGIDLDITDELIQFVAEGGYDPKFGGRNINRFIKDTVEQVIADKIIAGTVQKGQTLTLTKAELQKVA